MKYRLIFWVNGKDIGGYDLPNFPSLDEIAVRSRAVGLSPFTDYTIEEL